MVPRSSTRAVATALLFLAACERSPSPERVAPPAPAPAAGGAAPSVAVETKPVAGNVYMIIGRGGNIGVSVGKDGVLIVDDQFEDMSESIEQAIARLSKGKLVYVLNTHHHPDHTGGDKVFGKKATIVASENARKHMVERGDPAHGLPVITFDHRMSIYFNGEEIRLVALPHGHTDGDSAVFFTGSNVVHLGDHFFNGRLPFVDLDAGGNPMALLESSNKLLEMIPADAKLIPGHGDLGTVADYRRFHDMLADTIATVQKEKAAGKSLGEVMKAGFGGKYGDWANSFVDEHRWAELIYKGIR